MSFLEKVCILLSILPLARSHEEIVNRDEDLLLFPLMGLSEVYRECRRWRVGVEDIDVIPWKTIPRECGDYVEEYMGGRGYEVDLQRVSEDARIYATSLNLSQDGKDAWVFDVDETLLSNLPYYSQHGYGYVIYFISNFVNFLYGGFCYS